MSLTLPSVTADFDGRCAALDQAIREAAANFDFFYESEAPRFTEIQRIPQVIYELIRHYTGRGFLCEYDGVNGVLKISWDYPNMSYLEHRQITRAVPEMIPHLGIGFRASLLYLCMTNNTDLRKHSNVTMQRELDQGVKEAAAVGNTELAFGFPDVPAPVVTNLFKPTFDRVIEAGFLVQYDVNRNVFVLKWGDTLELGMRTGSTTEAALES